MDSEPLPSELQERLSAFDDGINKVEDIFKELHTVPINDLHEKMSALDKAKLHLIGTYAVNSLFWMYLNVKGENPKEHAVKQELDRIRSYMGRVKEIQDKEKAPKVDKGAAKRFVRNALWMHAQKKNAEMAAETSDNKDISIDEPSTSHDRLDKDDDEDEDGQGPSKKARTDKAKKKKKKKKNKGGDS